jgi:hypothetical protein
MGVGERHVSAALPPKNDHPCRSESLYQLHNPCPLSSSRIFSILQWLLTPSVSSSRPFCLCLSKHIYIYKVNVLWVPKDLKDVIESPTKHAFQLRYAIHVYPLYLLRYSQSASPYCCSWMSRSIYGSTSWSCTRNQQINVNLCSRFVG